MINRTTIAAVKKFITVGWINHKNKELGHYFWSSATNRHFRDKTSNWKVFCISGGYVFICSKVSGEVRQVNADYSIGCPMTENNDSTDRIIADNKREFDTMFADLKSNGMIKDERLFKIEK